jgi:putative drug exporter of the RND superfamily
MFRFLGRIAAAHPGKVLCAWIGLGVLLTALAPNWKNQSQDDDIRFLPANTPSVRAYELLEKAFPKDVSASKAIFAIERIDGPLTDADFALVDRLALRLEQLHAHQPELPITGIASYKDGPVGSRMVAADRHCTLISVSLSTPYLALQTRDAVDAADSALRAVLVDSGDNPPQMYATGAAGIGRDLTNASAQSLRHTTWATVILVVVVLLLVYRSPLLALIPLITIGMAAWVSLQILALATLIPGVHVVNVSQVFCIVILFGAGTDYCLFLISRYREELELGQQPAAGVTRAVRSVRGALAASAATVVCGLGMMGFAQFGKIRCAGPVIALGLIVGLAAALTLTPALLRLGKRSVFWPQRVRLLSRSPSRQLWDRISRMVVEHPYSIFVGGLAPLLVLAFLGLGVSTGFRPTGDLSPMAGSIRGLDAIQKHFTAGETGPLTVLLASRVDWDSPAGKEVIAQLSVGFGYLPNIAEVRSLTQPLGTLPTTAKREPPPKKRDLKNLLDRAKVNLGAAMDNLTFLAAEPYYLSRTEDDRGPLYVTRLDIILNSDPFGPESIETLDLVDTWLGDLLPGQTAGFGEVKAETCGVTVHSRDLGNAVTRDRMRVNLLVTLGVLVILLLLVRKLWLAGYLLGTVMLSYLATLGLTALFTMWLTGRPFGVIEWRVPFFLFIILVAVGEDYNILLVSRILQERKRHGMIEGVRRGLAATGGAITACGLIMAGTFGTLMLADLSTLKQIGFALAVGVLIDTLIVRPLLVPAFLLIVWKDSEAIARSEATQAPLRRVA